MEKSTPHCKLALVKALVQAGKVHTTHAARAGANELGFSFADIAGDVYLKLTVIEDLLIVSFKEL